jgi:acetyl esterase/lipase
MIITRAKSMRPLPIVISAVLLMLSSAAQAYTVRVKENVPYGPNPAQLLDVFRPVDAPAPAVAIVLIHGGEWSRGDKSRPGYARRSYAFASMGYVVFNMNYRLVRNTAPAEYLPNPRAVNAWPAQLEDAQLAVRWVRQNAAAYGVDPNSICAFGVSAGAHMAVFLGALNKTYPGDMAHLYPAQSSHVQCVIDVSGPVDLTYAIKGPYNALNDLGEKRLANSTDLKVLREASPIYYLSASSAPMAITQGTRDDLVPMRNATDLRAALQRHSVPSQLWSYDGGHVYSGARRHMRQIDMAALNWAVTHRQRPKPRPVE